MSSLREEFIKKYAQDVINVCRESLSQGYKLFPSVVMAQMILESGNSKGEPGRGLAAVKANNFFGIKADAGWKGPKIQLNTPRDGQPVSYFRVYSSPKDSINDHNDFLEQNRRYSIDNPLKGYANIFDDATPEQQAEDLAAARYSENYTTYAKTLISLINAYNLKELDKKLFEADLKKKL